MYKGTFTDMMEPVAVGAGRTRGEEEILSAKGIQERREGIAIVVEVGIGAGIGIEAWKEMVEQLNLMAIVVIVEVLVQRGCWEEDWGMELFIVVEGGLCMFQVPLRYPRVFFSSISLPLDQEYIG